MKTLFTLAINLFCAAAATKVIDQYSPTVKVGSPFVLHTIMEFGKLWPVHFRYKVDKDSPLGFSGHLEASGKARAYSAHHDPASNLSTVPIRLRYIAGKKIIQVLNTKDIVPFYSNESKLLCIGMTRDQNDYTINPCNDEFALNFTRTAIRYPAWVKYTQHVKSKGIEVPRCMSFRSQSYHYFSRNYQSVNPNCISNAISQNKFFFKEIDASLYNKKHSKNIITIK